MTRADLLVENGLNLEGGMGDAFAQAEKAGVKRFIASDHITVRHVAAGQGVDTTSPDQAVGAPDPHLWMDPLTMRDVVAALATEMKTDLGIDVSARASDLEARLTTLNDQVADHPGRGPAGAALAGHRARVARLLRGALRLQARRCHHPEPDDARPRPRPPRWPRSRRRSGRPASRRSSRRSGPIPSVAQAVGQDTGAKVVELTTHALPPDGSYFTFLTNIANLVADNLK